MNQLGQILPNIYFCYNYKGFNLETERIDPILYIPLVLVIKTFKFGIGLAH